MRWGLVRTRRLPAAPLARLRATPGAPRQRPDAAVLAALRRMAGPSALACRPKQHVALPAAPLMRASAPQVVGAAFPAEAPAALEAPLQRLLAALLAGSETGQVVAGGYRLLSTCCLSSAGRTSM